MNKFLVTTAVAVFVIAGAATSGPAQAAVAGPTSGIQGAAQSLNLTDQVRRICQRKLRCARFMQCRWEQSCYVTKDYPPEHGRR
jgi:hypothetical protein